MVEAAAAWVMLAMAAGQFEMAAIAKWNAARVVHYQITGTFKGNVPIAPASNSIYGVVEVSDSMPTARTNYRRWVNFSWGVVEAGGASVAAEWTPAEAERVRALEAARRRWQAAVTAGVDFIATDHYEDLACESLRATRRPHPVGGPGGIGSGITVPRFVLIQCAASARVIIWPSRIAFPSLKPNRLRWRS
jgi:hypothetical protein